MQSELSKQIYIQEFSTLSQFIADTTTKQQSHNNNYYW